MDADSWRQAKSVLEAALLCAPPDRDALIAARCADPSLRREVLACLNEHDESFLESALTISNTFENAASTDDVEAPPDVQPGERIAGRYEIVRQLGAGGMGHVFLAKDTDLERQVALKFLIAAASAADVRSRIFHEARAAARITHPNIAVVHDVGVHEGRAFLVMEYVEGENLAQRLKRGRPPLEMILASGRQLASALTAAHEKGIIHRDLKPANIQLTRDGSVKILDFGVAHAMASVDEPSAGTTAASVPLSTLATLRTERGAIRHPGTPAYMSPEQMFGKPIDGRSDIYSLGVILYEMSTGHRPYSTDDPLDVVLALSRNLLRPSGAETHLPDAVNDVIGKMLTVELDQRYQTAAEVDTALTVLMTPEPAPAGARLATQSKVRSLLRVAAVLVAVPLVVTALGFMTSAWFNFILGRRPPFSNESSAVWLEMGWRSLFAPAIIVVGVLFVLAAFRFVVRMLRLSKSVDSLMTASKARTQHLSSRLKFDNPAVISQAVATVGLFALAAVFWRFRDFIRAVCTQVSSDPRADLLRAVAVLRPLHLEDAGLYRIALEILMIFFSVAILRIIRMRAHQPVREGAGAVAVVAMLFVLTLLAAELPYRLVWKNQFERIKIADDRCYAIGENGSQLMAFCPDTAAPRTHVMDRDKPIIQRSGVFESIYTPSEESR
jgi:serine/threonine protein kinase